MPDFFDRLIARGTQQPGGGTPAPGQPARPAGRASDPSSGAAVAFARPRLPGPFEWSGAEPPDAFLQAVDEVGEVGAGSPGTARARPALRSLAGTQAGITPPPLLRDSTTSRAPGSATTIPGEQPAVRPAPAQQAPLSPRATPVYLGAAAAARDHPSARAGRPAADRDQERDTPAGTASRPEHHIPPPSQPRTLAVPASAVRAARPAADDARTAQAQPPVPPPVIVRIGRIEVRNTSQDRRERQAKRRARRAAPKRTLAEYLAAASTGRNGSGVSTGGGR